MGDPSEAYIEVPCLGRPMKLGTLYDCRNENFVPERTLWTKDLIETNAHSENLKTSRYEIYTDDSFGKKAKCFHMEPNIKLSFLSNLIKVSGSAKFLENTKLTHRRARVVLWYHCDTFMTKLLMENLKTVDVKYGDVVGENGATHVVTGVQYGFDAFFVFDRELTPSENQKAVEDFFKNALAQITKGQAEGHTPVMINEEEQKELDKFLCTFYGDAAFLNPPTTFNDAITAFRNLPRMLRKTVGDIKETHGVSKIVHLCPLQEFVDGVPEHRVLSSDLVGEILGLSEAFATVQISATNIIRGNDSCQFPGIQEQMKKFVDLVERFVTQVRQNLTEMLPKVRGRDVEQNVLEGNMQNIPSSLFDVAKLSGWLEAKKEESHVLENVASYLKECTFIAESELNKSVRDRRPKYILALSFGAIAGSSHTYLEELEEYLNAPENANEWDESFKEHWFQSDNIVTSLRRQASIFAKFANINKDNMDLKCLVVANSGKRTSASAAGEIFLYTDGARKPFQPPSAPGTPVLLKNAEYELEIQWQMPQAGAKDILQYFIAYQGVNDVDKLKWSYAKSESTSTLCRITQLEPNTAYIFRVAAVCIAGMSEYSQPSLSFATKALPSLGESLLDACRLLSMPSNRHPAWYAVPLQQTYRNKSLKLRKCDVGNVHPKVKKTKVILIVGATGSGKTTLINGMINYLFGIHMDDKFRLKLIDEALQESQAHSQTQYITAYTINWQPGSIIPYNLTIVDTPGYGDTRGIAQDDYVTSQIKEFFEMRDDAAIDQIDAVGFVAQASAARLTDSQKYVFDAILSIFGRNISSNIFMMLTFADGRQPPALDAIKAHNLPYKQYFKFNNSVFTQESCRHARASQDSAHSDISANETFDTLFWKLAEESFSKFFKEFALVEPQSLKLTKEVLAERHRLEVAIENIHQRINTGVNHLVRMREELLLIEQFEAEKSANKRFTRVVQVPKTKRVHFQEAGRYVTNCLHCNVTCHKVCRIADDNKKYYCAAMKNPGDEETTCSFCNSQCDWKTHVNRDFYFEEYVEEETITLADLKKKYDHADETLSQKDNILFGIYAEYSHVQMLVIKDIETVRDCLRKLDEIAMKRNPMTTVEYIDVLIRSTKNERKSGWEKRLSQLENARKRAEMIRRMEKEGKAYDPFQEFTEDIKKMKTLSSSSKSGGMIQKLKKLFGF